MYKYIYALIANFVLPNQTSILVHKSSMKIIMYPNSYVGLLVFILFHQYSVAHYFLSHVQEKCGDLEIQFPFHLNSNYNYQTSGNESGDQSWRFSEAFNLSCINSSSLYLRIGLENYRILEFFQDGLLIDFPNTSDVVCRRFHDFTSFNFTGNEYFGISVDNVVELYDCEDSSFCKSSDADCDNRTFVSGCDQDGDGNDYGSAGEAATTARSHQPCCYSLLNQSVWRVGDGFSSFRQFGCRGFSTWIVSGGGNESRKGVKVEWAFPKNSSDVSCDENAEIVNATSVRYGMRCKCRDGFVGDGFTTGVGCQHSCQKDGKEAYGQDCYMKSGSRRRVEILAGVLTSAFTITSLVAMFCLINKPMKSFESSENSQVRCQSTMNSFRGTHLFTYQELEDATNGFDKELILSSGESKQSALYALYAGSLEDGSKVAVHKVQCQNERYVIQVLSSVEILSSISHKNMSRLIGWSIDSAKYSPLVVYEYPSNGTLNSTLRAAKEQIIYFDWYKRLNIASEISCLLAFLQCEVSPPIFHQNLMSGCIFLDEEWSPKICGFDLLNCCNNNSNNLKSSDVYNLGLVLLELISGARYSGFSTIALPKIRSGKLEEIVDPCLYYHELPPFRREEIEIVADIATRCLLYGGDHGKLGMLDVSKELMHLAKESIDGSGRRGPGLEETFSNSSLLQMISMSPDSLYV